MDAKRTIIPAGFCFLLAACSEFDDREPAVATQPAKPASGTVNAESALPDDAPAAQRRELTIPPWKPRQVAAAPAGGSEELVGLDRAGVLGLLGRPAAEKDAAPAKVWTYSTETCVLQVFFYPEIATKEFQVLTYEVRGAEGDEAARQACIEDVLRANAAS